MFPNIYFWLKNRRMSAAQMISFQENSAGNMTQEKPYQSTDSTAAVHWR